ncbi:hypothetical protein J5Y03_16835 [Bacillus sp. RG28]|uniref:Uncharacterized protein n=1 Tax=Gottfriedia endophytica TaxID=2820819 RepID=A0A940NS54_9BACI|nr:hypothetical protein [Gottfriedia endophytica]MBP0726825.1 hypothetical protein [Gottfriedia endophytica]
MNRFLKLVNFELNRFSKIYIGLIILVSLLQLGGVWYVFHQDLGKVKNSLQNGSMSLVDYVKNNGPIDFQTVALSTYFLFPILLAVATLLIYVFLIWYRDWFGKNLFSYRLFMLPSNRISIYLAKATTILLLVFGMIALQMLLLPLEGFIYHSILPNELQVPVSILDINSINSRNAFLSLLIPKDFIQFLLSYGLGFISLLVIFTGILLERSFRWKGIILGIIYFVFAITLFICPIYINGSVVPSGYFYPSELLIIEIIICLLIGALSIWISKWLLNKKVGV